MNQLTFLLSCEVSISSPARSSYVDCSANELLISIINVREAIEAFREDCEDEDTMHPRTCHIVTNMQYVSGLWYSGATEGGKPCGRGVLVKSTCKKRAVVLLGTFSPYKGHLIPHASVVEGGLFSHLAFYQGNETTIMHCMYDGHLTITWHHVEAAQ